MAHVCAVKAEVLRHWDCLLIGLCGCRLGAATPSWRVRTGARRQMTSQWTCLCKRWRLSRRRWACRSTTCWGMVHILPCLIDMPALGLCHHSLLPS